jgi:hypothetical protein
MVPLNPKGVWVWSRDFLLVKQGPHPRPLRGAVLILNPQYSVAIMKE